MTWHPLISVGGVFLFALLWFALVVAGYLRRRPSSFPTRPGLTAARRALMGILLVVILAGPSVSDGETEVVSNVEVFLALDRTGSMAAEDWEDEAPRLEGVRRDMLNLLTQTAGSRYSVITWDSSARIELPVTTDSSAVAGLAQTLHQEISEFSAGSSLNRPLDVLLDTLRDSAESRPQNQRYLVLFSDGENTDPQTTGLAQEWVEVAGLIDGGAVIGYGTAEGGPMKVFVTGSGAQEEYMEDPDNPGAPAISKMDEDTLRDLGGILGVPVLINPPEEEVSDLGEELMATSTAMAQQRGTDRTYKYLIWPFALAFSGLLVWEMILASRYLVYMRRTHAL